MLGLAAIDRDHVVDEHPFPVVEFVVGIQIMGYTTCAPDY